jgi:hypothetical protein
MADEKAATLTGASAVADAVKRVADAAVAEVAKTKVGLVPELVAAGTAGGKFAIRGSGFGAGGVVKVNGVQVRTTGWSTTSIEGMLPAEAVSGEVVVHVDDKTARRGHITL